MPSCPCAEHHLVDVVVLLMLSEPSVISIGCPIPEFVIVPSGDPALFVHRQIFQVVANLTNTFSSTTTPVVIKIKLSLKKQSPSVSFSSSVTPIFLKLMRAITLPSPFLFLRPPITLSPYNRNHRAPSTYSYYEHASLHCPT
jgi:hypothetical protein